MKQSWLAVILVVSSVAAFGQITYEPGYIISSDGQRTERQIKNLDWKSNPSTFEYRINGTEAKGDLQSISEFGITGGSVFRRKTVLVDQSSDNVNSLTVERNPDFKQGTHFLRLLVSGKAVLYLYDDQGLIRFFYSVDGSDVSPLVYKRYLQRSAKNFETGYAAENEQYKQDLFNKLKCPSIAEEDVKRLKYERAALMKFFDRYNECTGSTVATNEEVTVASGTHIYLLAGVGFNGFTLANSFTGAKAELDPAMALRIGAELELVLPFAKGMWAFTIQPVYQTFSSQNAAGIKIDYSSLDFAIGMRRYLFIKDKNSLYLGVGAVFSKAISGGGAIKYPSSAPLDISGGLNLVTGIGYRVSKFTGEVSYGFRREIMSDYAYYASDYSGVILTLGYRLK